MICCCANYLIETVNKFDKYKVYICENCKRYYIKNFDMICEVEYNYKNKNWERKGSFRHV
jgi:hypothetical protein